MYSLNSLKKKYLYVSVGLTDKELYISLEPEAFRVQARACTWKASGTRLKDLGYKYALNHEMVRAVQTERQTRNCGVKCRIKFSFQWMFHVYGPSFDWKTSTMLCQCFSLFCNYMYLPLEKGGALPLNNLKSPSSKDALCHVWLKLA